MRRTDAEGETVRARSIFVTVRNAMSCIVWSLVDESGAHHLQLVDRQIAVRFLRERKEFTMSLISRWKSKQGLVALPIVVASILLAAPAAQARVGIGVNLGFPPVVVPPPVVVAPPVVAAPPVVVGPPAYYAAPPAYYYAPPPSFGFFWYDRFGHRHWRRH